MTARPLPPPLVRSAQPPLPPPLPPSRPVWAPPAPAPRTATAPLPAAPPPRSSPGIGDPGGFRADIEGLRAVAVLLVLAYHADLGPFPGGYVGVDVFFVLSGFLITALLLRELRSTGFLRLGRFWARRARRLLPASCLVIVATLVAGYAVLPPLDQPNLARDAMAAATFVINVVFAHRQSDYLASQLDPSPLLHFWSLALEEQFYLLWPLLLTVVAAYRRRERRAVAVLVAVLWPLSLAACIWLTDRSQPWAFFGLPTRAWELLTGAALALAAVHLARVPAPVRAVAGWAGVAGVVVAAVTFNDASPFPGVLALVPVLATAAVVASGPSARGGPAALLGRAPLQWVGKRSYSIYLWHWPALVLVAARFGPLSAWQRAAVLAGSVVLAAVTFAVVEDPVRHARWLAARTRRGLALGGALVATGVVASLVALASVPPLTGTGEVAAPALLLVPTTTPAVPATTTPITAAPAASRQAATTTAPTTTTVAATVAAALGPERIAAANAALLADSARSRALPANVRPALGRARGDLPAIYQDGCHLDAAVTQPGPCVFGDPAGATTVALVGDSHAAQWFPAFDELARRHGWRLLVLTKKGCPTAAISVFSPMVNRELRECEPWRANVAARLAAEQPDVVVLSSYRYRQTGAWAGVESNEAWRRGLDQTLTTLRPLAAHVLVLGDTPTPADDVPRCLSAHQRDVAACARPWAAVVKEDRLAVEREVAAVHDAAFVATGDWLCSPASCPAVVGDVLVYRDSNHLTATAAAWLAPYVEAAVVPLVGG